MNLDPPPADPHATPTDAPGADAHPAPSTGPTWLWLLLDPRSLQLLMLAGGGLLSLGLVIWLAVIGVFDDPLVAAAGLGVANYGLIGLGVGLAAKTRFRVAGRALAMLACVLLPLNLWFYNAQGLVTLADGGHLWLPAVACCLTYAAVAYVLRDALFVYAFTGGVAMTGLLWLADARVEKFWEVLAPSTLLVVIGTACLHAMRLFPKESASDNHRAFTQQEFGLAFFRAGHAALASGLGLLLAGRVVGRLYETTFAGHVWFTRPDVATVTQLKVAAAGLALAGVYGYAYSWFVTNRERRFAAGAILSLAWAAIIGLDVAGVPVTETLLVALLGVVSIGCRLVGGYRSGEADAVADLAGRVAGSVGAAVVVSQMIRMAWLPTAAYASFEPTLPAALAAGLVFAGEALAVWRRREKAEWLGVAFSASALAAIGVATLPSAIAGWAIAATATIPAILTIVAARMDGPASRLAVRRGATGAAVVVGLAALPMAFPPAFAALASALLLAAAHTGLATSRGRWANAVAAGGWNLFAVWQAVEVLHVGPEAPLAAITVGGLAVIAVSRLTESDAAGRGGLLAMIVAATAGGMLAGVRLLAGEAGGAVLGLMTAQAVCGLLAAALSRNPTARRLLTALSVGQAALAGIVINDLSDLGMWQRVELIATATGIALLVAGLVGWRREATDASPTPGSAIDFNLWLGSILATGPITLGLLEARLFGATGAWLAVNELGCLAVAIGLLACGVLCRLRAATLAGAASLTLYLASLLLLVQVPAELKNVAVYLIAGGGSLFTAAVLASAYRDRLARLPERVQNGDGVWAVLKWR